MSQCNPALLEKLINLLGSGGVIYGEDLANRDMAWLKDKTTPWAIARPKTTADISAVMKLCSEYGQSVVTQGGKTGMVDGAATSGDNLALSLERMSGIEELDPLARTMTVLAGTPLQTIQEAAEAAKLSFPLDLGARGSATIGGNIATNAGGNSVIRYGMTRNLILGLEAVLADGTVISSMHKVVKNNTAYDLKQWFIGTEGTLGIVSRAVLKLSPLLHSENTALLAVNDFDTACTLLRELDREFGGSLSAYEVMWNSFFAESTNPENPAHKLSPMPRDYPYYILIETRGTQSEKDAETFQQVLESKFEAGQIQDAVVAQSIADKEGLWAIRDNIESLLQLSPILTYDISLSIPTMAAYLKDTEAAVLEAWPEARFIVFGHLGDGNLHIIVATDEDSPERHHAVDAIIYSRLKNIGGVISAEHGIGTEKRSFLHCSRSAEEIAMMHTIKTAMDPQNLLNPGKVLPDKT
ncbi:MAG: FAD-binding oxidoreductase [Pseudomonadales bacterium]